MEDFENFIAYVRGQSGTAPGGIPYAVLADAIVRYRPDIEVALAQDRALAVVEETPTLGDEQYERWNEAMRRRANLAAVTVLRLLERDGREAMPEERRALLSYTGFGGFTHIGVLPSEYPDEYVAGSRAWASAIEAGQIPTGLGTDLFRGLKDQYFTPMPVCRAMWQLHGRAAAGHVRFARTALEPSAGTGRFLWTGASTLQWTAIEWDPLLVSLLRALYPKADVLRTRFEEWAAQRGDNLYDVIIGNPPYPRREGSDLRADREWAWAAMAHAYFTARSATKLSPLGTLILLTPLSLLTSNNYERERRELHERCWFRGAAVLPSGTFPNVREGSFIVTVWTRRVDSAGAANGHGANGHGIVSTPREAEVVAGRFFTLPEAEAALCGGAWTPGSRGGRFLSGAPDYSRIGGVVLSPIPLPEPEIATVLRRRGATPVVPPAGVSLSVTTPASVEAEVKVDRADALDALVSRWLKLSNSDPDKAEAEREPLRLLVVTFLAEVGNPHTLKPKRAGLRAITSSDGTPSAVLTEPVHKAAPAARPPVGASPLQTVHWFCERRGVATEADLLDAISGATPDDLLDGLLSEADVFVEIRPDGLWWYSRETYLYGDLYVRLAAIDAATPGVTDENLKRRLGEQKEALLDAIQPRVLAEIYVTPRSGFVPVECLRDWIAANTWGTEAPTYTQSDPEQLERWHKEHEITAAIEYGILKLTIGSWGELDTAKQEWATFLLAYWNRDLETVDPNETEAKRSSAYGSDIASKLKQEEQLEATFKDWLAESSWSGAIEEAYNRAFRSNVGVEVSADPIELVGFNPAIRLRAHQNRAVRRACLGGQARSLLCAFDVGAGKSLIGLATSQRWRQIGAARRPLIVVPSALLAKWYADASWAFPDANIGVIGFTPGKKSEGGEEVRREKWLKLGAGAYDLCIVSRDLFLDDVAPDEDGIEKALSSLFWVLRGLGKDLEERRLLIRRVEALQDKIKELEQSIREAADYEARYGHRPREKKNERPPEIRIAEMQGQIAKWQGEADEIKAPTDSEVETVRRKLVEFLTGKPFRPSDPIVDEEGNKTYVSKPGLVRFSELGVDALICDEAHAYKNLWYPQARLGSPKIEYAGSAKTSGKKKGEEEEAEKWPIVQQAWDMYFKCRALLEKRGGDGGVLFLTATPVKNSPLELYSMLSYLSARVWEDRKIRHKEEFIDRYWKLQPQTVSDTEGEAKQVLAVTGFKQLDELNGILASYMDRKTIADLIAAGIFKQEEIPVPKQERAGTPPAPGLDPVLERDVAQRVTLAVCNAYRKVLRAAMRSGGEERGLDKPAIPVFDAEGRQIGEREIEVPEGRKEISAGLLLVQDMMQKIATDPRLLVEDVVKVRKELAAADVVDQEWEAYKAGTRKSKPKKTPATHRWRATKDLRLEILAYMNLPLVESYYERVKYPPKVKELARRIKAAREGCSHIVFVKWTELIPVLVDALVNVAGVPRERITKIVGEVKKADRYRISQEFNGRDEVRALVPENGKKVERVIQEAIEPVYDVVIGTDGSMGEGIDLQRRTCSIHHITLPWEPATIQQRNGRGIRQGAQETEIDVIYYITRKTFDGLMFGKIVGKQAWQDTLFSGVKEMANPAVGMDLDPIEADWYLSIEDDALVEAMIKEHRLAQKSALDKEMRERATEDMVRLNGYFLKVLAARDDATRESLWRLAVKRQEEHQLSYGAVTPEAVYSRLSSGPVAFDATTEQFFSTGDVARNQKGDLVRILDVQPRARGYVMYSRAMGALFEDFDYMKGWTRAGVADWNEPALTWPDDAPVSKFGLLSRDLRPLADQLWRDRLIQYAERRRTAWARMWWGWDEHADVQTPGGSDLVLPPLVGQNGAVSLLFLHHGLADQRADVYAIAANVSEQLATGYTPLLDWSKWAAAIKDENVRVLDVARDGTMRVLALTSLKYQTPKTRKITDHVASVFFRRGPMDRLR